MRGGIFFLAHAGLVFGHMLDSVRAVAVLWKGALR